jgi:TetR/AcrR family transcriptional regulator, regulator of autoinduction and epiphytic fitness
MTDAVNPRRSYDSPLRREQADATRRAILDTARGLFLERGYVATTVAAIAKRAEVSAATVYQTFGNKRSVLARLVDVSIAGDEAPIPLADRPWVRALREEADLRQRIRILARNGTVILERRAPIDAVVAAAAATDPEIATLWRQMREERHAGQARLLTLVAGEARLRRGAADVLYAIGSPETYRSLVEDRGWSPARFERWYAEAIERLLLRE